jgi:hypothetical protein
MVWASGTVSVLSPVSEIGERGRSFKCGLIRAVMGMRSLSQSLILTEANRTRMESFALLL